MSNYERLKCMAIEEMAHAIVYKGFYCGGSGEGIGKEGSEHFKREVERWVQWFNGTDPRHITCWAAEETAVGLNV